MRTIIIEKILEEDNEMLKKINQNIFNVKLVKFKKYMLLVFKSQNDFENLFISTEKYVTAFYDIREGEKNYFFEGNYLYLAKNPKVSYKKYFGNLNETIFLNKKELWKQIEKRINRFLESYWNMRTVIIEKVSKENNSYLSYLKVLVSYGYNIEFFNYKKYAVVSNDYLNHVPNYENFEIKSVKRYVIAIPIYSAIDNIIVYIFDNQFNRNNNGGFILLKFKNSIKKPKELLEKFKENYPYYNIFFDKKELWNKIEKEIKKIL